MKIATGGISHETNTFNILPTDLRAFQTGLGRIYRGEEIVSAFNETNTVTGGFIDASKNYSFDLIPTFYASAPPTTGMVKKEAFEYLEEELLKGVQSANADGVLLNLHGAMVAEGYDDPEGHVLRSVRNAMEEKVPIVLVHDLHGNITNEWVETADVIIGYKTAPHTDMCERGVEGGRVIVSILRDGWKPTMALEKPSIIIGGGLMTVVDTPLDVIKSPLFWVMSRARELEKDPKVINVTVAGGFGHADTPDAGMGIVVTTNNDPKLAKELAKELSDLTWKLRRGFLWDPVLTPVDVAVRGAVAAKEAPVILADEGDNTAGGGPGDGTTLLKAFKEAGWPDAALFIRDAEAVDKAVGAGVGEEAELLVGGKTDNLHGEPVRCRGRVKLVSDGRFLNSRGEFVNMGRTAVLECGETQVVLTEYPTSQIEPAYFRSVGIEPKRKKIIVVQSAHLFRHQFQVEEHIPKRVIEVDTPGITSPNLSRFTFRKVRRPIFPLDDI